jgi:hypothetical protein
MAQTLFFSKGLIWSDLSNEVIRNDSDSQKKTKKTHHHYFARETK